MPKFTVTYTSQVTIVADIEASSHKEAEIIASEAGVEDLLKDHGLNDESKVTILVLDENDEEAAA